MIRSECLTGVPLDRPAHHVQILDMNGESLRLNHSRARKRAATGSSLHPCEPEVLDLFEPLHTPDRGGSVLLRPMA